MQEQLTTEQKIDVIYDKMMAREKREKNSLFIKWGFRIFILLYIAYFFFFALPAMMEKRLVKTWTGNFYWAEKYIGRGGTYLVIIFAGIFCIGLWVIYPFGWLDLLFGTNNSIK